MRYWKGGYDEDQARYTDPRLPLRLPRDDESQGVLIFRLLVGLQAVALIAAILLFATSR